MTVEYKNNTKSIFNESLMIENSKSVLLTHIDDLIE